MTGAGGKGGREGGGREMRAAGQGVVGGRESEQGISQVKQHSPKLHNGKVCICSKKKNRDKKNNNISMKNSTTTKMPLSGQSAPRS